MSFAQHNHMIEALSACRADEPFDERILPGTANSRFYFFDAKADNTFLKRPVPTAPAPVRNSSGSATA